MFSLFRKKAPESIQKWQREKLNLEGMHCTSCAVNIDLTLEDVPGVKSVSTHYAKNLTTVEFDPAEVSIDEIAKQIESLGYTVKRST